MKEKEAKERKEMHLWFSKSKADTGKIFFVPNKRGKEITQCTDITEDLTPPTESSEYMISELLPSIDEKNL